MSAHPASTVIWNTVLPALGVALVVGAPMLWAIGIAAVVALAIHVALTPAERRRRPSPRAIHHA